MKKCHVFAVKAGQGYMPYYVGKTEKSFRQECFGDHKLARHYSKVLTSRRGTPVMFFISQGKGP